MIKSDNAAHIGKHAFEISGLGKPPYRFCGVFEQPGSCEHCSTGIKYNCVLESSDGKRFRVGTSCLEKSGDQGLIHAYKTSPERREIAQRKAQARDDRVTAQLNDLLDQHRAYLNTRPWSKYIDTPWADHLIETVLPMCGAAGRARYLATVKKAINEAEQPY